LKKRGAQGEGEFQNPTTDQDPGSRDEPGLGFGSVEADLSVAKKELEEMQKKAKPDLWELAKAYAAARKKEETIGTLLKGISVHEPGLLQIRTDPDFDWIRDDPRYEEFSLRENLS